MQAIEEVLPVVGL
jgi:hypothetical protein